jgi:hypothetical protein
MSTSVSSEANGLWRVKVSLVSGVRVGHGGKAEGDEGDEGELEGESSNSKLL